MQGLLEGPKARDGVHGVPLQRPDVQALYEGGTLLWRD